MWATRMYIIIDLSNLRETERERERERETDRQTDRQTENLSSKALFYMVIERERAVSYTHLTLPTRSTV